MASPLKRPQPLWINNYLLAKLKEIVDRRILEFVEKLREKSGEC